MDLVELTFEDRIFLEKFSCAKVLNLSYTGLKNLKNLPTISSVKRLDISDNNLNGDDLHLINLAYKNLKVLNMSNNLVRNSEHVALLSKCTHMRTLDMSANPITETQYYRENVFEKLAYLQSLDGYDKDGSEWSLQDMEELRQQAELEFITDSEFEEE